MNHRLSLPVAAATVVRTATELADQVGALARLRDEGKIRFVGLSEVSADQLAEARRIVPIATVQNRYHLTERRRPAPHPGPAAPPGRAAAGRRVRRRGRS
jgi:aryl-alcohol dehydrogenase-like predicted oxidoreductase